MPSQNRLQTRIITTHSINHRSRCRLWIRTRRAPNRGRHGWSFWPAPQCLLAKPPWEIRKKPRTSKPCVKQKKTQSAMQHWSLLTGSIRTIHDLVSAVFPAEGHEHEEDNKITNLKQILTQQWAEADDAPAEKELSNWRWETACRRCGHQQTSLERLRGVYGVSNPNTPARSLYCPYKPGLQQQKIKIYTVDFFVTLQNGILVITCVSGVLAHCRFTNWKAEIYSFKMVYDRNIVLSTSSSRVLKYAIIYNLLTSWVKQGLSAIHIRIRLKGIRKVLSV